MYPVSTYATRLQSAFTTYATGPVQSCIAHINEFVFTRVNHPLARAAGPLTAIGVVALTAHQANIAWNKKCTSQTSKVASRSFALVLTALASFVTFGTVTSMTDRKLLALPALGVVLFTALCSTTTKTSRPKIKEGTPNNPTAHSPNAPVGIGLENAPKARTEAASEKTADPIDQATAAQMRIKNAPEIAKKREKQTLAKRQFQEGLEAEKKSLEQSCNLEQMRISASINFRRLNKLFNKQDVYKRALQRQRELLLELFSDLSSEMQRRNQEQIKMLDAPENLSSKRVTAKHNEKPQNQNSAKSYIRIELQYIEKLEGHLRETQGWLKTSNDILRQSIDEAIKYHIKIGGTPEEAKEYWENNDPSPELRQQRMNKDLLDQKVAKTFWRVVDLWNLRLDNEIQIASNLVQQRLLRMQKIAVIEKSRAINQKTDLLQILQELQSQKDVSNAEVDQSNLSQVQNAVIQSQQIEALLEKIDKSKLAYEALVKNAKEVDAKLKVALGQFQRSESSTELQIVPAN